MRKFWVIIALLFSSCCAFAQDDISFRVEAPSQVNVEDVFEISFILSSNSSQLEASNFKAPAFKGLNLHSGPLQSNSSNTSIINGVRQQSYTIRLFYRVSAPKEGMINFGPASIDVKGKTYKTSGVSIQVSKKSAQNNSQQQSRSQGSNAAPQSTEISKDDLFIEAKANKTSIYEGQEAIVSYKIFTSVSVASYSTHKVPSSQGFWVEDLASGTQARKENVQRNGKNYVTADIRKVAVYPQMDGKLSIEPMEVEAIAQVRTSSRRANSFFDFFDDPFSAFGGVQNVKKVLKSNPVTFNVKPLPEKGKPLSFKGNVGTFKFNAKTDKTTLKANEALTITITISGNGNLKHIEAPEIQFPADFEVYEPREVENIKISENGMSGSKTFEYLAIPRTQGSYTIPAVYFSYFDPNQAKYIEHHAPEQNITVTKSDAVYNTGVSSKNEYLNRDIEFIKTKTIFRNKGEMFLFSPLFWILSALPLMLFIVFLWIKKRLNIRNSDVVGLRQKRALKLAKKCLAKADKFMKDNKKDEFYIEISQALWGFLSQKFNIPIAELSIDNVYQTLTGKGIPADHINQFTKALENCEFARFAPNGQSMQSMQDIYNEALSVISNISLIDHEK